MNVIVIREFLSTVKIVSFISVEEILIHFCIIISTQKIIILLNITVSTIINFVLHESFINEICINDIDLEYLFNNVAKLN